jgi:fatty-acyl-CoA synthase
MTDGHFLEQGEVGEIVAKGYNIMKGYIGLPDELQSVDADGWLHTGDLGLIDEEGYIRLKGRAKELIIRGGENISPIEVENAICEYEDILSCKVVGAPHDFLGEEVVACIALKKRNKYSEEELKAHLSKRIAEYKIPSRIIIYDELPMTDNGKIDTKLLKEQVKER